MCFLQQVTLNIIVSGIKDEDEKHFFCKQL